MSAGVLCRRPTWVGTSWKMNKTIAETRAYCRRLSSTALPPDVQVFILPPLTALAAAREALAADSPVLLGAQNGHWRDHGAWTGEVSMPMLRDAGATLVEIGHSERREHFGETDETVGLKTDAALRHGLTPLVCVGEPQVIRENGDTEKYVLRQVDAAVARLPRGRVADLVVAYEPVWAIGANGTPATPELVSAVIAALAAHLADLTDGAGCRALLYGGGVSRDNAAALLALPPLDGLFVGRSAWDADGLLQLVDLAARGRAAAPR